MKRVVVHVDRLVLHGFDGGEAAAISAGLTSALHGRLAAPDAVRGLAARADTDYMDAGEVRVVRRRGSAAVGRAVAGRIVRSVAP